MTTDASSLFDSVKARLRDVKGPDAKGWHSAFCPFHDDRHRPNLRFTENGFNCHSCKEKGAIRKLAEKLGVLTLDPFENRIETTYDYHGEHRALLYQVVRLHSPKDFRQRRPDGNGGWIWDLQGVRRVPYRLPGLLAADRSETVFVVEGEKDVDRLISLGLVATTNSGGAGKWKQEHSEYLRGRKPVIIPDNDDVGRKHAHQVAQLLCEVAEEIRILQLPDLPEKGDVSDWLSRGGTVDGLGTLARAAPIWCPPAEREQNGDPPLADDEVRLIAHSVSGYAFSTESRHLTDLGNAERLIDRYGATLRFVWGWQKWLAWDGHRWLADDGGVAEAAQKTVCGIYSEAAAADDKNQRDQLGAWAKSSESANRRRDLIDQARSLPGVRVKADTLDRHPWLLTTGNGTLDLRDGKLRESRPEDMLTLMTPVEFDADATCPRWLRFLDEVFQGNADLIEFIQRSAGYCLTGVTTEQVLWLMHGSGANGKDVFQGTLRAMLGDLAFNAPFSTFELNARPSIPNDVAALLGRRLVTAAETLEGTRLNEARVKALTGSTVMTARFLHAEYFQFEPRAKYWLAMNHLPVVKDDSYAFWRRIRLIPFNRQFKEDADPHLLDTLAGELPGILTWALDGCLRWQTDGLRPPAIVTAATEEYQRDSDPLAEFLADRCVFHPQHRVQAGRFYTAYRTWAQEQGLPDKETLGSKTFGQRAQGRFRRGPHTRDGYWYFGVGLAADGLVDGEDVTGEGVL